MYCVKCGEKSDDDALFCIRCGERLNYVEEIIKEEIKQEKESKGRIWIGKIKNIGNGNKLKMIIVIGLLILSLALVLFLPNSNGEEKDAKKLDDIESDIDISDVLSVDTAEVAISSIPSGTNIYINDLFKGSTPITINLPAGDYDFKTNITGYKSIRSYFNITNDDIMSNIGLRVEVIFDMNNKSKVIINKYKKSAS